MNMDDQKPEGILLIDKPAGPSSARMVGRVKRLFPRGTKVGHAGTLDPFATGLLIVLVGRATRRCELLMDEVKVYEATVRFGATTPTEDPTSPEQPWPDAAEIPCRDVEDALGRYVGEVMQRPSAFSALRIGGKRAYALARAGEPVDLPCRPVRIHALDLLGYQWPVLSIRITCGRGTYIRALARDLGEALKVGGYLTALRRTRVGAFDVQFASDVATLSTDNVRQALRLGT